MGTLSPEYKKMLLKLTPDDITASFINEYLADRSEMVNGKMKAIPSKIKTYDTFELLPSEYFNKEKVLTNVGLFIYNKFIVEESFQNVLGYINTTIDVKVHGSIEDKLSKALLDDLIDPASMAVYFNKIQWLSKQFNSVFAPSFTMNTIKPIPEVVKKKEELLAKNKDLIDKGDVITVAKIEKELVDVATKRMENDPGMALYRSGARGSLGNNYKAISIIKGPIANPSTGKWDIVTSNFMDGFDKKDIPAYGNAVVNGAYPKAVGTQVSGYSSKQLTAAFQGVVLDAPGTDCGTNRYITLKVTDWNKKDILYRYMIEGNKLVLLDDSNVSKYLGKEVKLRSPMYCTGDKICSKCAGILYEKLGIPNIGLTASKAATSLSNLGMKKFHDTSIKVSKIDINNISL